MSLPQITPQTAMFLDIDGTLIDLAATPDAVIVPATLPDRLRGLQTKLGGALAILSGRRLADIDHLLGPGLPCGAEHGAIIRDAAGNITTTAQRPANYDHWLQIFQRYASIMPGILVEEKSLSLVLHYRQAPKFAAELRELAEKLINQCDDAVLMPAHCALELKAKSGGKDAALSYLMSTPPFAGRTPIFIGDDTTDEPAITRATTLGGTGLHVARNFGGKTAAVREWLGVGE